MNQHLTDLLQKKQKQSAAGSPINWDERRDDYLKALHGLYQQIETIFAGPIGEKTVTLQRRAKQLIENYLVHIQRTTFSWSSVASKYASRPAGVI